jgi:hypothetical protein
MDVSSVRPGSSVQLSAKPAPVSARAADGDYTTKGPATSTIKDADGDFRPRQATTSASTQNSLGNLKIGGN